MRAVNSKSFLLAFSLIALATLKPGIAHSDEPSKKSSTLKVLLVAGGCCHDYQSQTKLLKDGIEQRIHANVTVVLSENKTTKASFEIYQSDDWAKAMTLLSMMNVRPTSPSNPTLIEFSTPIATERRPSTCIVRCTAIAGEISNNRFNWVLTTRSGTK